MSDREEPSVVVSNESDDVSISVHCSWNDLQCVQHIHTVNEFTRQLFGRINAQGLAANQLSEYKVKDEDKEELDKGLNGAESQVSNISNVLSWDTTKRRKKQGGTMGGCTTHTFECDFYVRLTKVNGDSGAVSFRSIMLDVAEDIQLLNEKKKSLDGEPQQDVMLKTGDMLWMEIAETPQSLRNKLLQLERAFRVLETKPRVVVVCLNGEKGKFDAAVKHFRGLFVEGKLSNWKILQSNIRVFVTYTPYRNVYGTLHEVKTNIDEIKSDLSQMKYMLLAGLAALLLTQVYKK